MEKAPATRVARASQNVAVGTADVLQIALRPLEIQKHRLQKRFGLAPATAAAVAEIAFAVPESWRGRL